MQWSTCKINACQYYEKISSQYLITKIKWECDNPTERNKIETQFPANQMLKDEIIKKLLESARVDLSNTPTNCEIRMTL